MVELAPWSVERIGDRLMIQDVLSRYGSAVDRIQVPALAAVFHDDAIIDNGASRLTASDFLTHVGERQPGVIVGFHLIGNIVIDFLEDCRAFVESYGLALEQHPACVGEDAVIDRIAHVRYGDLFERRAVGWRILHRIVVLDYLALSHLDPKIADPIPASHFTNRYLGVRGAEDPIFKARVSLLDANENSG